MKESSNPFNRQIIKKIQKLMYIKIKVQFCEKIRLLNSLVHKKIVNMQTSNIHVLLHVHVFRNYYKKKVSFCTESIRSENMKGKVFIYRYPTYMY